MISGILTRKTFILGIRAVIERNIIRSILEQLVRRFEK